MSLSPLSMMIHLKSSIIIQALYCWWARDNLHVCVRVRRAADTRVLKCDIMRPRRRLSMLNHVDIKQIVKITDVIINGYFC